MLSSHYINRLITGGEFTKFDLKAELCCKTKSEKAELVRHIIAIANSPGRVGHLLFGIYDNRQPSGALDTSISEEQIQKIVKEYAEPYIETSYEIATFMGLSIGLLTIIREAKKLPYRFRKTVGGDKEVINKDDIFYRHGRHSEKASYHEIEELILEGTEARHKTISAVRTRFDDKYATLNVANRKFEMLTDLIETLFDNLGFTERLWNLEKRIRPAMSYQVYPQLREGYKFDVEIADKIVGMHHYLFMFYVHPFDIERYHHLEFHRYAFEMVPKGTRVAGSWKRFVIILTYGKTTKVTFKRFIEPATTNILVKTSFGFYCGPSELTRRTLYTWEPRLYLTNIVSKECMEVRLQEALRWIEENPDLAEPAIKITPPFKRLPATEVVII